ncbi:pseudouridine synthase [Chytriomyces sp. MP71]|nr:pseudouridine synthase [Chytriomyces sp. MP71]
MAEKGAEYLIDIEKGLRRVLPYWHTYRVNAKGRWFNRRLLDVFAEEFKDQQPAYYESAISRGILAVNGNTVSTGYIIKSNDIVTHKTHKHEPPVSAEKIRILRETDDVLVINKPASIPVHPTGRYNYNSVTEILKSKEFGFKNVFSVNRIDRHTSGIVLIALTKDKAAQLSKDLADRNVEKTYLARVKGKFPDGITTCAERIVVVANSVGINHVSPDGLPCETIFERLSFNGKTSVVKCTPKTGRMHQIRIHLQFLGYPISNDPLYASQQLWGPDLGKGGVSNSSEISARVKATKLKRLLGDNSGSGSASSKRPKSDADDQPNLTEAAEGNSGPATQDETKLAANSDFLQFPCPGCRNPGPDPTQDELRIFLHALKYRGDDWSYESPEPQWAKEDFQE